MRFGGEQGSSRASGVFISNVNYKATLHRAREICTARAFPMRRTTTTAHDKRWKGGDAKSSENRHPTTRYDVSTKISHIPKPLRVRTFSVACLCGGDGRIRQPWRALPHPHYRTPLTPRSAWAVLTRRTRLTALHARPFRCGLIKISTRSAMRTFCVCVCCSVLLLRHRFRGVFRARSFVPYYMQGILEGFGDKMLQIFIYIDAELRCSCWSCRKLHKAHVLLNCSVRLWRPRPKMMGTIRVTRRATRASDKMFGARYAIWWGCINCREMGLSKSLLQFISC